MPFAFRKQPLKAAFLLGSVVYIVFSLPIWALANALPAWRPRRSWSLGRAVMVKIVRTGVKIMFAIDPPQYPPLESYKKDASSIAWVDPAPPELIVGEIRELAEKNEVKLAKIGGFWLGSKGPDGVAGQRAKPEERVIYHLHGGGHVMGGSHPSTSMGPGYEGYLKHFGPNTRIFGLEYRLSSAAPFTPANPFPASLLDAIAGYRYLLHDVGFEPHQIIIAGDSAGGGIALNLAYYLAISDLPKLPQAGGLLLLSPTMDWAQTYADDPNSAWRRNALSDFVQGIVEIDYTARALRGQLPDDFVRKSLWISPGSRDAEWKQGTFSGLPLTMILAGGAEQTLDGMLAVRDRMLQDMGKERLTYVEILDAAHDILMMKWFEPERTEAFVKVAEWVDSL
ncbi:alpha/beta-hydrolase [Trametes coccinea BRFM310]|uniref:Alpha/beta-hydrolase n=1 Tax=Trametes coccinea (strain BRFM310) TaxID=1353009 RepID=A0A1Y2ID16_TRAC3|nr:alpha/beta-hydrolase [Trametes coccinea BRFM310]